MVRILLPLILLLSVGYVDGVWAQPYPAKPVRIINPFSPGGSLDLVSRLLAKGMSGDLGQQFIVENRPGAGGSIGIELVAKSPPDGHTLLMVQSSITVQEHFMDQAAAAFDATTVLLLNVAQRKGYDALPPKVAHDTKLRLLDAFTCALAAYQHPTSALARKGAQRVSAQQPATVWGSTLKTTPEAAAFTNGVMTRLLDISDTYLGKSRGHPSDMISGLMAVAESAHCDGKSLLGAIALAYDVYCSFADAIDINSKGWDQPVYGILGCVLGAGRLLKLDRVQLGHAIALALAPNMALAQARRGHLSNWKGCAGANASRNAVFAAMLAQDGFTGPSAVFEGEGGLWDIIGRHDWPIPEGRHWISETYIKGLPVCYHGQSSVYAALQLRDQVKLNDIDEINVGAYKAAVAMMGTDANRWAPATHETADHSMPFCVASALRDGEFNDKTFSHERLHDPLMLHLMAKVKVAEDRRHTSLYPEAAPGRVRVRMKDGKVHECEVIYPKGHAKNPMNDAEIIAKFNAMTSARLSTASRTQVFDFIENIEKSSDVSQLPALLAG
jgi:2-methylcitrate dehydratase